MFSESTGPALKFWLTFFSRASILVANPFARDRIARNYSEVDYPNKFKRT